MKKGEWKGKNKYKKKFRGCILCRHHSISGLDDDTENIIVCLLHYPWMKTSPYGWCDKHYEVSGSTYISDGLAQKYEAAYQKYVARS